MGSASKLTNDILAWYERNARALPWRVGPKDLGSGLRPDPYKVWLSEIMLQQTVVATVKPYYGTFLRRWPTVTALAEAPLEDVLSSWAGLGYYARARNLKRCAKEVCECWDGRFPSCYDELITLPGIGPYTAAAIAAIAFAEPVAVVDGNVERVISRLYRIDTPLPAAKVQIRRFMQAMTPQHEPGNLAQGMMDLGAVICRPKAPKCSLCPLTSSCLAYICGEPERFPIKQQRKEKPMRKGAAFVAFQSDGSVLLRRRAPSGLLGGMVEVPTSSWSARQDGDETSNAAPFAGDWQPVGAVKHIFTHFELHLQVFIVKVDSSDVPDGYWWSGSQQLKDEALPSIMQKVIALAKGQN